MDQKKKKEPLAKLRDYEKSKSIATDSKGKQPLLQLLKDKESLKKNFILQEILKTRLDLF